MPLRYLLWIQSMPLLVAIQLLNQSYFGFSNLAIPDINHYSIHIIQTISKSYHLRCGKNIYNKITNSKRHSWSILTIVLLSIVFEMSEVSFTYSLIDDQIKPWYLRWMNLNENLAVTIGGGFFGGILIGYALKKVIKIVTIIAGFFLAALAYLQYQQIASLNWDKLQAISENTLTTLANAMQQIPGFDGNGNVPAELMMTNLGIPLTGSLAIGFTIGFMRG